MLSLARSWSANEIQLTSHWLWTSGRPMVSMYVKATSNWHAFLTFNILLSITSYDGKRCHNRWFNHNLFFFLLNCCLHSLAAHGLAYYFIVLFLSLYCIFSDHFKEILQSVTNCSMLWIASYFFLFLLGGMLTSYMHQVNQHELSWFCSCLKSLLDMRSLFRVDIPMLA